MKIKNCTTTRQTLMGIVNITYPASDGNYFWIKDRDTEEEYKVVNMYKENYTHLQNILQKRIEFEVIDGVAYAIVEEEYKDYFFKKEGGKWS